MRLTSFFHPLRSAYQAELDDLTSDSEGKDVLRKRLADKRKELDFLVQMMELSPEMVAVVFHRAFRFGSAASTLERFLTDEDTQPDWTELAPAITLETWAQPLVQRVLQEPQGAWFLAVAACLEYLQQHPRLGLAPAAVDEDDDNAEEREDSDDDHAQPLSADDATDPQDERSRDEASEDWLSGQGFDRKD
jgi:hypothetical protein